jgi:uncharacterized membrane protein
MSDKKLELERLVFFSDAIVAIAITLLALDLKIGQTESGHLRFSDVAHTWRNLLAFALSFLNIAVFWKIHHQMFQYIRKIDTRMLWYNMGWLLFIVTLPFTTSLVSAYFSDTAAIFLYCLNTLFITIFQNALWDYASIKPAYLKEHLDKTTNYHYRLSFNVAMVNAILACMLSFISPAAAFITLFLRLPMIAVARKIFRVEKRIPAADPLQENEGNP